MPNSRKKSSSQKRAQKAQKAKSSPAEAGISQKQVQAVLLLVFGYTVMETAAELDVCRETVHRWLRNPELLALRNQLARERIQAVQLRLHAGTEMALLNVLRSIERGDVKLSYALLKDLGALAPLSRSETNPEWIAREQAAAIGRKPDTAQLVAELLPLAPKGLLGEGDKEE